MKSGFEFIGLGHDAPRVISIRITGELDVGVMAALTDRLEPVSGAGQKRRLDVDLVTFEGSHLDVVRDRLAHISKLWNDIELRAYWAWMSKMIGPADAGAPMYLRAPGPSSDRCTWWLSGE